MIHGPSFRLSLRRLVHSKKFLFAIILSCLPAIFGALLLVDTSLSMGDTPDNGPGATNQPQPEYYYGDGVSASFFLLAGTVPLVALLLAGGMLADDVEDRTLSYLLVRPVRRATQYRSRLAAVILATAGLALFQAILFAAFLGIEWNLWYQDAQYLISRDYVSSGATIDVTTASGPIAFRIAAGVLTAAPLLGAGLAALFGFISLVATRFHFLANLIVYLAWELPFGIAGDATGPGIMTVSFAAANLVQQALPEWNAGIAVWLSLLLLGTWIVLWGSFGAALMQKKDFTVTSARS